MILLQAANVGKSFGAVRVLTGVNLTIQSGERAGIVGINGAGKSTLLQILAGTVPPDEGDVIRARDLSMAYLAQDGGLESKRSIWDEVLSVFAPLQQMEKQLREMEKHMGDPALAANEAAFRQLLAEYDSLSAEFKTRGGFEYEANTRGVLHGLKFGDMDYSTPVANLSGGQKTRLALARCLLAAPELLMLDEPTNYLDMDNLAWLEQYLQSYRGTVLVVSHDRYFLDALVKVVYELSGARLSRYTGNYTAFVSQKAAAVEQQLKEYNRQREDISRLEEFVRRNMAAKDTVGRARSRQKVLDKMERLERPDKERRVAVSFGIKRPSGQEVLQIEGLTIGYPGLVLARGLNFGLGRGERVALLGPNGIGKSTLLKTIAGQISPLEGRVRLGAYVQPGYYEQEQEGLARDKQVLHELWDRYPNLDEVDVRTVLGRFLFRGDDVYKLVADLSGGERSRLALAALMLQKANFLLLDEPTNHLDLSSKEVLEEALADYPGTILFVSHDRYFINKMAGRIVELSPFGATSYPGNYDYYLSKRAEQPFQILARSGPGGPEGGEKASDKEMYLRKKEEERQKRKRQRRIEEMELTIAGLEETISRLEKEMYLPEVYQDFQICRRKEEELQQARSDLQACLEKWLELQEES